MLSVTENRINGQSHSTEIINMTSVLNVVYVNWINWRFGGRFRYRV